MSELTTDETGNSSTPTRVGGFEIRDVGRDVVITATGDVVSGSKTIINNIEKAYYTVAASRPLTKTPYKFLAYYDIPDRDIFFGRDRIVQSLQSVVTRHRVVVVSGPSGAGKSSLVNAGLIPRFADNGYHYVRFRDYTDPARQLADCLTTDRLFEYPGATPPATLLSLFQAAASHSSRGVIVVLDQFERCLLSVAQGPRNAFIADIGNCVRATDLTSADLNLVLVVRHEFLGRLLEEFDEAITDFTLSSQTVFVRPLTTSDAREAIVKPLTMISEKIFYDPQFVDEILIPQLNGQSPGEQRIEPAHLQVVCNRLYEAALESLASRGGDGGVSIGSQLYDELGGARGILQGYLDKVIDRVAASNGERVQIIRSLLKLMIQSGRTRQFISFEEMMEGLPDVERSTIADLLQRLQDERVVEARTREGSEVVVFSVSHEILVPKVVAWFDEREMLRKKARETLSGVSAEFSRTQTLLSEAQLSLVDRHLDRPKSPEEGLLIAKSRAAVRKDRRRNVIGRALMAGIGLLIVAALYLRASELISAADDLHEQGIAALASRELPDAEILLAKSLSLQDSFLSRVFAWRGRDLEIRGHLLQARARGVHNQWQRDPGGRVMAFAPNLSLVAVAVNNRLVVQDARTGEPLVMLPAHSGYPAAVTFSEDGKLIAFAFGFKESEKAVPGPPWKLKTDGAVHIWSLVTRSEVALLPLHALPDHELKQISSITFSRQSNLAQLLAFATEDGGIQIWSLNDEKMIWGVNGHKLPIWGLAFSAGNTFLAAASEDRKVSVWDYGNSSKGVYLTGHEDVVMRVAFGADDVLASGSADGTVRLWNIHSQLQVRSFTGHYGTVTALSFQPDGGMLASGCEDEYVRLFDLDSGNEIVRLRSFGGPVLAMDFGADGIVVAGGASQATDSAPQSSGWEREWRIGDSSEVLTAYNGPSQLATIVAGSKFLVSGDADGQVKMWSYSGKVLHQRTIRGEVLSAAVSKDESWLATGGDSGVQLWSLAQFDGAEPISLYEGSEVWAISFDPDGHRLAFGSDRKIFICPLNSPGSTCTWFDHLGGKVWNVAFSPDGKVLASAGGDNSVRLWDPDTHRELHRFLGHTGDVYALSWSPSGALLATGSVDRTVRILTRADLSQERIFRENQGSVTGISFGPSEDRLAAGSLDHTVRLWSLRSGSPVDLGVDERPVWWVSINPKGEFLASASLSRQLRIWNLSQLDSFFAKPSGILMQEAEGHTGLTIVDGKVVPIDIKR